MRAMLFAALLLASCSVGLGKAGSHCSNSEECGAGLLCDTTQTPHVCSTTLAHTDDLSENGTDLAGVGMIDLAYLQDIGPQPDMTGEKPQDMSAVAHDMTEEHDMAKPHDM